MSYDECCEKFRCGTDECEEEFESMNCYKTHFENGKNVSQETIEINKLSKSNNISKEVKKNKQSALKFFPNRLIG